jgi:hypothetical protein
MNVKRIQQQLSMVLNILAFVFDPIYQAILNSLAPYKEACEALQIMADNLSANLDIYRKLLKSLAEGKKAARLALAEVAYPIMSVARAYCLKNGLNNEASQLKCTLSELQHMSFPKIVSKMSIAIPIVENLLPQLGTYNITAAKMTQWSGRLTTLKNLMSTSTNAKKERTALGVIITQDMETMLKFFNEQPCTLVADFISTNPQYYISFQNIKRIGTPESTRHTRLMAHCQSELGVPYFGLTVTVNEFTDPQTGKTYPAASSVTDPSGDSEVSGFFADFRTVTVSGPDVETTTFPALLFERSKALAHTFIVRPSFSNIPAPQEKQKKLIS